VYYLIVLVEKIGVLIVIVGWFGVWFVGCDDVMIEVMCVYGEWIGVVF